MQSIKRLCLLLIFILFATGTMIAGQVLAADWYDSGWNYRQKITIDESMIPDNGDLSDFPVLIQFTSADNNPVFANARSDGYDILFTESDGTSLLDHEIEEYNSSTEDLNMWVRIPVLDDDGPTEIYMYYGNPGITTDPSTTNTWDSNFLMVQHLQETSGTLFDSTSNSNNGTPEGSVECNVNGKLNGGCNFDAGTERVRIDMSLGSTLTIDAWAQLDNQGDMLWTIDTDNTGPDLWFTNNNIYLNTWDGGTNPFCGQPANVNQWHHYVAIISPGNTALYVDGSLCGTAGYRNPTETVIFIGSSSTSYTWDGRVDEVRISDIARSADWIETSYNNQNNPSTFYTVGSEEALPDLIVSYLSIPKARKNRRGHIARVFVDYKVINQGDGDAVASELDFYLSRDTVLDGSDIYVGTVNIPALASGEETPRLLNAKRFKLSRPVFSSGTWYLLGAADAGDDNVESDETNNVTAVLVTGSGR